MKTTVACTAVFVADEVVFTCAFQGSGQLRDLAWDDHHVEIGVVEFETML